MIELRIGSGKDRGMRGGGQRHMCVSAAENDPLLRHCVQIGSKTPSRAEETHAVSARGVKGDDNYVGMECRLRSGERERRTATEEETQPPAPHNHRKRESTIGRLPYLFGLALENEF